MIAEFEGKYAFLSNFYSSPILYDGIVYPTNEHFFQAMKTLDQEERKKIAAAETPGQAKRLGRHVKLRTDWEQIKVDVMRTGLMLKFTDANLAQRLIDTGDEELIEGNWWGDRFWGQCEGIGRNMLGQLLMELREKLKTE